VFIARIGSLKAMGTDVNAQRRLKALRHLTFRDGPSNKQGASSRGLAATQPRNVLAIGSANGSSSINSSGAARDKQHAYWNASLVSSAPSTSFAGRAERDCRHVTESLRVPERGIAARGPTGGEVRRPWVSFGAGSRRQSGR
jgi:hypothetical protein